MKGVPIAAVAVVAVVALAGLLWPWGTDETAVSARTPQYDVSLRAEAPKRGANALELDVRDHRTRRPVDIEPVLVTLVMPQMGHTLPPVTADRGAPGHYRVARLDIPMAGRWEVTVSFPNADVAVLPLTVR